MEPFELGSDTMSKIRIVNTKHKTPKNLPSRPDIIDQRLKPITIFRSFLLMFYHLFISYGSYLRKK